MEEVVRPNAWVALRLPPGNSKVIRIVPNTTISLGKYGSFPANLILERPYHLTYELRDKQANESFCRLRIVPASELHEDILADEAASPRSGAFSISASDDDLDHVASEDAATSYALVDTETNTVAAQADDDGARQTLTQDEIEILKQHGAGAGKDLIARLMLSHTALDQKTAFSLAKYKLVKTKKYIRRFTVLPLDLANFSTWQLEQRDAGKILDLRAEMIALVGCLGNVHHGGESVFFPEEELLSPPDEQDRESEGRPEPQQDGPRFGGRWLVVDDTGGLLTAAMAERMGILHPPTEDPDPAAAEPDVGGSEGSAGLQSNGTNPNPPSNRDQDDPAPPTTSESRNYRRTTPYQDDFHIPYSRNNTITLISPASQPNLAFLKYFGYENNNTLPNGGPLHPLATHLLNLTWLQLLAPQEDFAYSNPPPSATDDVLASWKSARRGNYHRKRRRWARTRHTVHSTRAGNFAGLITASTMDPIGILQHTLPLLAGGAPIAIYSPALEPLTQLADCFSVARRAAWVGSSRPAAAAGETTSVAELERWAGTHEFPLNPTLVLGATVQTSRVRQWQVLPGRTHPVMGARGGAEGYVFSGWRAKPAEGKVEARGKFNSKKVKKAKEQDAGTDGMEVD